MTFSSRSLGLLLGLASLTSAMAASARPFRVNDIPNGTKYGCLNCHGDTKATTTRISAVTHAFISSAPYPCKSKT
ncbi:hypothetical protein [Polyangium mundeleinium]|uniref:Cytochrome C n=1 Tax=Polyangium mundeleinium TaxID=2995306 RepID=A0ABT5EPM3_9BACT|nr:hypothetical protein [Polyangium mundeleinium]MDC0742872.1 hypothetical protein [Polyangium mundeleinium]